METLKTTNHSYLLKVKGKKRYYMATGLGLALVFIGFAMQNTWPIAFGIVSLGYSGKYLYNRRNAQAGIRGERAVTTVLQELNDSYFLINDLVLPNKSRNIDHVVFGPNGVFCIETKNWMGEVRCYGDEWSKKRKGRIYQVASISKQARGNAFDLSETLHERTNKRVWVSPIVVFTELSARLQINNATLPVLRITELSQHIRNANSSTRLTKEEILSIAQGILPKAA